MIDKNKILTQAVALFGRTMQLIVASEELSELNKEITKQLRGIGNRENLIEELADVKIVTDEIRIMYSITDSELEDEINYKLVRLNNKILGVDYAE